MSLSPVQRAALEHVAAEAGGRRAEALAVQDHIRMMCDIPAEELREAVTHLKRRARVALHFHPDRPGPDGQTVAQCLMRDGRYRSQWETGLSNGGLSARPGGQRDRCEQRLFGGVYQSPGVTDAERPKYGSLALLRHADGPSPRFGSCYLVLAEAVSQRCTFTYLDSHERPIERGTLDEFDDVFSALLRSVFYHEMGLGESGLTVPSLVRRLRSELPLFLSEIAQFSIARNLNHYIEAQVHGDVLLNEDADALVADASFQGTDTGLALGELCRRYKMTLHWRPALLLSCDDVPRDFRGPKMPSLAQRVARSGWIDASAIGDAVRDLASNPSAWRDRGSYDEVLQELKLLWHVLVKYGKST